MISEPMIQLHSGDILKADVEALVNTVNTVGAMGKGIALKFRHAYPEMFAEYQRLCEADQLTIGRMHVYDLGSLIQPRYVINFPTKQHWRAPSKIEYIEKGLVDLVAKVRELGIRSIAIPPLGCGSGGLNWSEVRPLIERAFSEMPDVNAWLYPPQAEFERDAFKTPGTRLEMTATRAKVLAILSRYLELGYDLTLIEVQKLLYFLQEAGESLNLRYAKGTYGPYADNLRFVLQRFEGHFTRGFAESKNAPKSPLTLVPEAVVQAYQVIGTAQDESSESAARLKRVETLIEGYESPYGMELLASVHWVVTRDQVAAHNVDAVIAAVHAWSSRKAKVMRVEHVQGALEQLNRLGWLKSSTSAR